MQMFLRFLTDKTCVSCGPAITAHGSLDPINKKSSTSSKGRGWRGLGVLSDFSYSAFFFFLRLLESVRSSTTLLLRCPKFCNCFLYFPRFLSCRVLYL
jgi:hypothetical protein